MRKYLLSVFPTLLLVFLLSACSLPERKAAEADVQATVNAAVTAAVASIPSATPDVQATIDAAVKATDQAKQAAADAIDSAVQATVGAMPGATPVPPAADAYYTTLTEEELAAQIDQAVNEAVAVSQQTSASTTQATSDGSVSDGEVQTIQVYVSASEQAVANAEALIAAYSEMYGDYASAYLTTLQAMEQDLAAIAQNTAEIAAILEQGAASASAAVDQLNAAAQNAQTKAGEIQTQAQDSKGKLQEEIQTRLSALEGLQPNEVASDRLGAVQQTFQFVDGLKAALGSGKITPDQLKDISQKGVNASASLRAQGGPQLQQFAGGIDKLNRQAARGEWPAASKDADRFLDDFQKVDKRPGRK